MNRRRFLAAAAAQAAATAWAGSSHTAIAATEPGIERELTVAEFGSACAAGELTSRRLTERYLARIEALDRHGPQLRAVIETNSRALELAASLDDERARSGPRGPLHGVPVLIKDNIETADPMMTTAGSLALEGWYAPADAPVIARLRAAGAVILGKTNLSEWANFRSTHSSSGWSGRGGQTRNPYALDRSPSGSSSGSAVAVASNLCLVAVGTETDGSIVSPASINGVVGIKPTVGLISRRGIVPLSHSQDTAGPIARTVRDAAVLLGAMAGKDDADAATVAVGARFETDYTRFLDHDGLRGARVGIARRFFAENAPLDRYLDACVATLKSAGAIVVDPTALASDPVASAAELDVLLYEFKTGLNAYLGRLPAALPVHSLAELIRFNDAHADAELAEFDQELLRQAEAKGTLEDKAYRDARKASRSGARERGIDAALKEHRLDALVALTAGPAWLIDPINGDSDTGGCSAPAAVAGYPHITVPAGLFRGLPVGLSFFGTAFSEPTLLRLAAGFESVAAARVPPRLPAPA
jgi:amidase